MRPPARRTFPRTISEVEDQSLVVRHSESGSDRAPNLDPWQGARLHDPARLDNVALGGKVLYPGPQQRRTKEP
jgi:hypothetical protein